MSPLILGSIDDEINLQGYSWEREWRYTKGKQEEMKKETEEEYKLRFDYDDIIYICCPDEDENQIQEIVKENQNIKYLKTWEEYNEIIDFLDTKDFDKEDEVEDLEEKQRRIGSLINRYESGYQQIDKLKERLDHIARIIEEKKEKKKEEIKREIIIKIISDKLGDEAAVGGVEKTIRNTDIEINLIINNLAYTLCKKYKNAGAYLYNSINKDHYSKKNYPKQTKDEVDKLRDEIINEFNQSLERHLDLEG
jgi:hypothetical protein